MRSAIVDLGSNTFHLLVADVDEVGVRKVIVDRKTAVRIGEHAFAQCRIPAEAYSRGLVACADLVASSMVHGSESCRVLATGVFREAENAGEFLAEASKLCGISIELIDGQEEARLTWLAVSAELAGSHGQLAVIDLGGGSLECVRGTTAMERAHSLPLGALRLRELAPDVVRHAVIASAGEALRELCAAELETVAISSGTARALLRLACRLGLVAEGSRYLGRRTLGDLARMIGPLPPSGLASLGVDPSRLDTIATGAVILHTALDLLGRSAAYVARTAVREGALIDLARARLARMTSGAPMQFGA